MGTDNISVARSDNVLSRWYRYASIYDPWVKVVLFPAGGEKDWRRVFLELIDPKPGDRVVELCCGTGAVTLELAKQVGEPPIVASDLSPDQIDVAKRKADKKGVDIEYSVEDASHTPYPSSSFDKVVISGALHEIRSRTREAIYEEVFRLLDRGGFFYVSEPEHPRKGWGRIWHRIFWFMDRAERETAFELMDGGLEKELSEAGFRLEEKRLTRTGFFQCVKCSRIGP